MRARALAQEPFQHPAGVRMTAACDVCGGPLRDDAAAGNTAVVVEHNLDVMAEADWILDMGPEAGDAGGRIVAQGTPAQIARRRQQSHTGRVLEAFLRARTRPQPAGVT